MFSRVCGGMRVKTERVMRGNLRASYSWQGVLFPGMSTQVLEQDTFLAFWFRVGISGRTNTLFISLCLPFYKSNASDWQLCHIDTEAVVETAENGSSVTNNANEDSCWNLLTSTASFWWDGPLPFRPQSPWFSPSTLPFSSISWYSGYPVSHFLVPFPLGVLTPTSLLTPPSISPVIHATEFLVFHCRAIVTNYPVEMLT